MQITFFSECPNILILYIKQLNNKTFIFRAFFTIFAVFLCFEDIFHVFYTKVLRDNLLVNIHKVKTY